MTGNGFLPDLCFNLRHFIVLSYENVMIASDSYASFYIACMLHVFRCIWMLVGDLNFVFITQPHAPVVSRAALFLECSYFVHCCNKGQWPNWMKLNFPIFRPSGPLSNRGATSGLRRTHILQRTAGKLFHQWAEVDNKNFTCNWHTRHDTSVGSLIVSVDSAYTSHKGLYVLFHIFCEFF
jgi:hypothetical protein